MEMTNKTILICQSSISLTDIFTSLLLNNWHLHPYWWSWEDPRKSTESCRMLYTKKSPHFAAWFVWGYFFKKKTSGIFANGLERGWIWTAAFSFAVKTLCLKFTWVFLVMMKFRKGRVHFSISLKLCWFKPVFLFQVVVIFHLVAANPYQQIPWNLCGLRFGMLCVVCWWYRRRVAVSAWGRAQIPSFNTHC